MTIYNFKIFAPFILIALLVTATTGFNLNLNTRKSLFNTYSKMDHKSVIRRFAFDENSPGFENFISPINYAKDRGEPLDPLIFGLWKVGSDIAEDVVYNAIREGYRRFDSATDYGNEVAVGLGIQRAIDLWRRHGGRSD